jgi:hypothetical protein
MVTEECGNCIAKVFASFTMDAMHTIPLGVIN